MSAARAFLARALAVALWIMPAWSWGVIIAMVISVLTSPVHPWALAFGSTPFLMLPSFLSGWPVKTQGALGLHLIYAMSKLVCLYDCPEHMLRKEKIAPICSACLTVFLFVNSAVFSLCMPETSVLYCSSSGTAVDIAQAVLHCLFPDQPWKSTH